MTPTGCFPRGMKDPEQIRALLGETFGEIRKVFGARAFIAASSDELMAVTAEAKKNNTAVPAAKVDAALKAIHTNLKVATDAEEKVKVAMGQLEELMKG